MTKPVLRSTAAHSLLTTRENGLIGLLEALYGTKGDAQRAYLLVQLPCARMGILTTTRTPQSHQAHFELIPANMSWLLAHFHFQEKTAEAEAEGWTEMQQADESTLAQLDFQELQHSRIGDLWSQWLMSPEFGEELAKLTPGLADNINVVVAWQSIAKEAALAVFCEAQDLQRAYGLPSSEQTKWLTDKAMLGHINFGLLQPLAEASGAFLLLLGMLAENAPEGLPEVVHYLNRFEDNDLARGFYMLQGKLPVELLRPYQTRIDGLFRNCHTNEARQRFLKCTRISFDGPRPVRYPLAHMLATFYRFSRKDLTVLCEPVAA